MVQVVFEATYRCNSNCIFCYNCWKHEYDTEEEMELEQIRTVLKRLPNIKRFVISGGEPLLRNDLEEIIRESKKYTKSTTLLTSGILVNESIARMLKKYDVFVQIPIHGLEKTHNELTGVKDGYRKAISGIAWLKKHNVRYATTAVANRKNIHELEKIFELGITLGASELQVIRFMPGGEGMKNNELMLSKKEYIKMLEVLNKTCRKYRVFGASGAPNVPCIFPDEKYKYISIGSCGAGIDWIVLDPSGRVRICNHSPTILGNLLEQDFKEIWTHPILKAFRSNEVIPKECDGCEKRLGCRGGCRAVAETYYGSLFAPDPLMDCNDIINRPPA